MSITNLKVTPIVNGLEVAWTIAKVVGNAIEVKWRPTGSGIAWQQAPRVELGSATTSYAITGLTGERDVQVLQIVNEPPSVTVTATPLAAPPPPPAPTLPKFGFSPGSMIFTRTTAARQAELDQCKAAGAQMIRLDCMPGSTALAPTVADITARGMVPMMCLYGTTPPRAADTFGHDQAVLWAGATSLFEVCNEPDLNGWTPDVYADFVKATSASAKAGNPNALVIAGALWKGSTISGVSYVTQDYVRALVALARRV